MEPGFSDVKHEKAGNAVPLFCFPGAGEESMVPLWAKSVCCLWTT